jgi:flagellar basal body-associated protein FliL
MSDSKGILIIFGVGIVTLGIVAIAYFAFLSQKQNTATPTNTYVQVPNSLRSS